MRIRKATRRSLALELIGRRRLAAARSGELMHAIDKALAAGEAGEAADVTHQGAPEEATNQNRRSG